MDVYEDEALVMSLCVVPKESLPEAYNLLTHKLMIEGNRMSTCEWPTSSRDRDMNARKWKQAGSGAFTSLLINSCRPLHEEHVLIVRYRPRLRPAQAYNRCL